MVRAMTFPELKLRIVRTGLRNRVLKDAAIMVASLQGTDTMIHLHETVTRLEVAAQTCNALGVMYLDHRTHLASGRIPVGQVIERGPMFRPIEVLRAPVGTD